MVLKMTKDLPFNCVGFKLCEDMCVCVFERKFEFQKFASHLSLDRKADEGQVGRYVIDGLHLCLQSEFTVKGQRLKVK